MHKPDRSLALGCLWSVQTFASVLTSPKAGNPSNGLGSRTGSRAGHSFCRHHLRAGSGCLFTCHTCRWVCAGLPSSLHLLPNTLTISPFDSLPCLQVGAPRTAQSPTPPAQYPQGRCPCAAGPLEASARQPQAPALAARGTAAQTAAAALLATPARGRAVSPQVGWQQAACRCLSQPGLTYRALLQQCCVGATWAVCRCRQRTRSSRHCLPHVCGCLDQPRQVYRLVLQQCCDVYLGCQSLLATCSEQPSFQGSPCALVMPQDSACQPLSLCHAPAP